MLPATLSLHYQILMLGVATIFLIPTPLSLCDIQHYSFIMTLVVLLQVALVGTALVTALILLWITILDFFVNCNTSQQLNVILIIACSIPTSN
jgi:hypothetical protein